MSKKPQQKPQQKTHPTMSLYQNGDAVEGILQQVFNRPLITDLSNESSRQDSITQEKGGGAKADLGAAAKALGVGSAEAGIGADYSSRRGGGSISSGSETTTSRYTQAYYLYAVRDALRERSLIQALNGHKDARGLTPGDFVEFTCRFAPSQVAALLDIITPELVRHTARYMTHAAEMGRFTGRSHDEVLGFIARKDSEVAAAGELAYALAAATGVDFRSSKTREFYGRIGEGDDAVTAITMCDLAHFVIDDEDRLLDGQFSVLAKVTDTVREDVPVLGRNKVLSRINPKAVDHLLSTFNNGALAEMQERARDQIAKAAVGEYDPDVDEPDDLDPDVDEPDTDESDEVHRVVIEVPDIDLSIDSRIEGPSIKVMPIAIYV